MPFGQAIPAIGDASLLGVQYRKVVGGNCASVLSTGLPEKRRQTDCSNFSKTPLPRPAGKARSSGSAGAALSPCHVMAHLVESIFSVYLGGCKLQRVSERQ
jgi:hypothetical protein